MPSKLHPRRLLPRIGIILVILFGLSVTLGIGLTDAPPPLPESTMQIQLPGGQVESLGEILEAGLSQDERLIATEESNQSDAIAGDEEGAQGSVDPADLLLARAGSWLLSPDDRDPYRLGRELADRGNVEGSIALLRSVPKDHPEYARSQRYLGWDLYTKELKEPRVGMHFIRQSIRDDPLSGNAWQDGYRALGHTVLPEGAAEWLR